MVDYGKFFPIDKYYEKVVEPVNKKYFIKNGMLVCPLHADKNPSLGLVKSKQKGQTCHCFGCNYWGNIVDFHVKVSAKLFNKVIDENTSKKELCDIFGIDVASLPEDEFSNDSSSSSTYIRRRQEIQNAQNEFNIQDYRNSVIEGKIENKGIGYFNYMLVKMIGSEKSDTDEEEVDN